MAIITNYLWNKVKDTGTWIRNNPDKVLSAAVDAAIGIFAYYNAPAITDCFNPKEVCVAGESAGWLADLSRGSSPLICMTSTTICQTALSTGKAALAAAGRFLWTAAARGSETLLNVAICPLDAQFNLFISLLGRAIGEDITTTPHTLIRLTVLIIDASLLAQVPLTEGVVSSLISALFSSLKPVQHLTSSLMSYCKPVRIDPALNPTDFEICGGSVNEALPNPPQGATLGELERIAQKYWVDDQTYKMRDIQEVIRRIRGRVPFQGVPLRVAEREVWYQHLERAVLNIVAQCQVLEEQNRHIDDIQTALTALAGMVGWCSSDWKTQPIIAYKRIKGQEIRKESIQEQALGWVAQFRASIVEDLSRPQQRIFGEDINPHVLNEATFQIHKQVQLPGGSTASQDEGLLQFHPSSFWDSNYFPRAFFKRYTKQAIVDFFVELINGIKPDGRKTNPQFNRDEIIDWFRAKLGDEGTADSMDENGFKRDAIEYFLRQIGVLR